MSFKTPTIADHSNPARTTFRFLTSTQAWSFMRVVDENPETMQAGYPSLQTVEGFYEVQTKHYLLDDAIYNLADNHGGTRKPQSYLISEATNG